MPKNTQNQQIEKFLSFVLRHSPQTIGLEMSKDGWVSLQSLIEKSNSSQSIKNVTLNEKIIQSIVESSSKQRFSYSEDGLMIRANQGHSLKNVELEFTEITESILLYHGTKIENLSNIMSTGLQKMSRHHVHLSPSIDTATEVGKRYGEVIIFEIDVQAMINDGVKIFKSENNVFLTDSVAPKYLTLVEPYANLQTKLKI